MENGFLSEYMEMDTKVSKLQDQQVSSYPILSTF